MLDRINDGLRLRRVLVLHRHGVACNIQADKQTIITTYQHSTNPPPPPHGDRNIRSSTSAYASCQSSPTCLPYLIHNPMHLSVLTSFVGISIVRRRHSSTEQEMAGDRRSQPASHQPSHARNAPESSSSCPPKHNEPLQLSCSMVHRLIHHAINRIY